MPRIKIPRSNGGTSFVELCGNVYPWSIENKIVKSYLVKFDHSTKIIPTFHLDMTNEGKFSEEYPKILEEYFQNTYKKSSTALAEYIETLNIEYEKAFKNKDIEPTIPGNIMRLINVKMELYREHPHVFYSIY